jgi:hypothetical protein
MASLKVPLLTLSLALSLPVQTESQAGDGGFGGLHYRRVFATSG